MSDPMDLPEHDGMDLAVPFVACTSQDGPYDDGAFVAGFQAGDIDRALTAAAASAATHVQFTAYATLGRQLELIGMHRGFPTVRTEVWDETPEWVRYTFVREGCEADA